MGERRPRWVFIAGCARSGSTLLGLLLAEALDGFFCGELHHLWHALGNGRRCQCGEPVARCEVWVAVAERARHELGLTSDEEGTAIMRRRLRSRELLAPRMPRPGRDELELRAATQRAVEEVTGESVLVDSSKLPSVLWTSAFTAAPLDVVHLLRDPRAVVFSQSRPKDDPGGGGGVLAPRSLLTSSADWIRGQLAAERVARRLEASGSVGTVLRLRYEDLVDDPATALAPLAGSLGADVADRPVRPRWQHALDGNPIRFDPGVIRRDDRWRRDLDRWKAVASTVLTLPLLHRYGYRINPWVAP
jgi:sulfotransferase family protein